jgi:hypothetical protein
MSKFIKKAVVFGLVLLYLKENEILYIFRGGLPAINEGRLNYSLRQQRSLIGPVLIPSKTSLNSSKTRDKNLMQTALLCSL